MFGVVGEVITVDKIENPTESDIASLLLLLEDRMKDTFDKHKAAFGWGHVELVVK
jgi:hypothetical protein